MCLLDPPSSDRQTHGRVNLPGRNWRYSLMAHRQRCPDVVELVVINMASSRDDGVAAVLV